MRRALRILNWVLGHFTGQGAGTVTIQIPCTTTDSVLGIQGHGQGQGWAQEVLSWARHQVLSQALGLATGAPYQRGIWQQHHITTLAGHDPDHIVSLASWFCPTSCYINKPWVLEFSRSGDALPPSPIMRTRESCSLACYGLWAGSSSGPCISTSFCQGWR